MHDHVITGDVYESCYYILRGCTLLAIEGTPINGKISCRLKFTGPGILEKQAEYFSGKACVDLFEFRRTYQQICTWIQQAKRRINHQLQQTATIQGGAP
jgi:hypothetical protein